MSFDFGQLSHLGGQIDHVLSVLPYPLDKDEICQQARQAGANDQVISAMEQVLPDKMFNSAQDIKECLSGSLDQTQV